MMFLSAGKPFRLPILSVWIALALGSLVTNAGAVEEIQFNTDVLDINDRKNIDLSQFTRGGYIMPGTYGMTVHVNKSDLPEQQVPFMSLKTIPTVAAPV